MQDFEQSFQVFLGTTNKALDLLDNPYIEVNVYDIDQNFVPTISNDVKMRMCNKEKDFLKFMDPNVALYYPNALCFDDLR